MLSIRELRESCGDGTDHDRLVHATGTRSVAEAHAYLHQITLNLLNAERYGQAGYLLWGAKYDPRPQSVKAMLRCLREHAMFIVLGCSSASKSYTSIAWLLMDWIRDPAYTGIKIIGPTAGHAAANVFSTLHDLYGSALFPLPGIKPLQEFIGLDPRNQHAGITLKSIPQGEDGKGALQGFHPQPRSQPHPQFGRLGRVRVYLDEAEETPSGVWSGIRNLCSNLNGTETIKVICTTNPKDVTSILARNAEPPSGWARLTVDQDFEWESRERFHVLRVDGAQIENVKEGHIVYPGFLTLEGYRNLQLANGGNSPDYWSYGRGMYPLAGTGMSLIPVSMLDPARGDLVFKANVVDVAAVDLAFEGDDLAKMALLRYGETIGFRPIGSAEVQTYGKDEHDNPITRWAAQIDQVIDLKKLKTEEQYEQIRFFCEQAGVDPDWLSIDRTGNGTGVNDLLHSRWSHEVMGVGWGEAATDTKIMDESQDLASEICDGIHTEMYWAFRQWLEFGFIYFGPNLDVRELFWQFSNRKVNSIGKGKTGKARVRLQSKKEFKRVYGRSPDDADAVVMALHRIRLNGSERASMSRVKRKRLKPADTIRKADVVRFENWTD